MDPHLESRLRSAIFLVALCIATVFLFQNLGAYSLWDDEAYTALVAQGVWTTGDTEAQIGQNLVAPANAFSLVGTKERSQPPLMFFIAAPSIGLLGPTSFAARLPFALIGMAAVCGILAWARKSASLSEYVAVVLATLGNVSLFLYCRQSRYYAPELLFVLLCCWAYWQILRGQRRYLLLGLSFLGAFLANPLTVVAFALVLGLDWLLFVRRRAMPTWKDLIRLAVPIMLVGIPAFLVWCPLGKHAMDVSHEPVGPLKVLRHCWLFLRDASVTELIPGIAMVLMPLLYLWHRCNWYLRIPLASAGFLVLLGLLAPRGDWHYANIRYAMPVLLGGIACIALWMRFLIVRQRWLAISVVLLLSFTNTLCLRWLYDGSRPQSTLALYMGELMHPLQDPYALPAEWIRQNVPAGSLVAVLGPYAAYPLMYHAPQAIYGWQMESATAARFPGIDPRQIRGRMAPDYLVAFGPALPMMKKELSARLKSGYAYRPAAIFPVFWQDRYRPELYLRDFSPRPEPPPDLMVTIMQRAPEDDYMIGVLPKDEALFRTGEQ